MTNWKYTDDSNTVVLRVHDDGRMESMLVTVPEIQAWLAEGNTPEPADQPSPQDAIKAQIAALEATVTPRRVREAVLGTDNGWLANVEAQIAALRP